MSEPNAVLLWQEVEDIPAILSEPAKSVWRSYYGITHPLRR